MKKGRARRVICGFIAGVLLRCAFYPVPLLQRVALIIWAIALIIFGALSSERLEKIKRNREWWEKDWTKEEKKWR